MRASSLLFWLAAAVVAACGGPEAANAPKQAGGGDGSRAPASGRFECTDVDAALARDAGYRVLDRTEPAARPPLPPRTVADKFTFAPNDHDGDGIDDEYDLCPASAEDGREPHPFDGCAADADHTRKRRIWPDLPRVVVKGDRIDISEQIHFAPASAKILEASRSLIAAIAQAILDNPEIELVEVAGHADKQGDAKANVTLTHQRAKAVVDALVARGVDARWLRPMGYGEYCPLDAAGTKAAFAKNRRVELRIIRRDGKELTPSWGGCEVAEKQGVRRPPGGGGASRPKPPSKPSVTSTKGAPSLHGSCRARYAAECEVDCSAGSTESCYVGAHEHSHATDEAALGADRATLKRECDAGLFPACSQLALALSTREPETALALAGPACEKGDGVGCGAAALLLQRGCSVPPDPAKAYALAKKGCALDLEQAQRYMPGSVGDRAACGVASTSLWLGLGVARDRAAAYALDQRACAAGLPRACTRLAQAALSEPALVADRGRLVATLHDACEQAGWEGQAEECVAAASVEKPGEYASPRLCDAGGQLECAKKCAESDWEPCMDLYLSALYRGFHRRVDSLSPRGWTVRGLLEEAKTDHYKDSQAKSDELAAEHYAKACSASVPSGCIHHARMRLEGRGVFRDPAGAAQALDEWCARGEKMACAFLAHAAATKKIPGGAPEGQRRMAEACKAGLKRACK